MKKILLIFITLVLLVFAGCSSEKTGTLSLKLTDAPTDLNIEKAVITISQVAVHKAGADENESSWTTVVSEPQVFDLITLVNVSTLLGEKELGVGDYTQVRLSIDSAVVTIDGQDFPLEVPSDKLKLTKGFSIEEGKTTVLTLDFDAKESIKDNGNEDYKLNPVIKIIQE